MKVTTDGCLFGGFIANEIINSETEVNNCLDIGAGTGLLSLMIAQKNKCKIDAVEIDKNTAAQANENIMASSFEKRVRLIHADAKELTSEKKYDLIFSNPPFYENELKGDTHLKNLAHHDSGLLLQDLLSIIKKNLTDTGSFYLLLPYKRCEEIKHLFLASEFSMTQLTFIRQTTAHDYFRIIVCGKFKSDHLKESYVDDISIKDDKGNYTAAFIDLLKDYYLHL